MLDAKLAVNGIEVTLGNKGLRQALSWIPDGVIGNEMLLEIAEVGSAKLREYVANSESLDDSVVEILLKDKNREVLIALLSNDASHALVSDKDIERMLDMDDHGLLETIVENIRWFDQCDTEAVLSRLSRHIDPTVRGFVADSSATPTNLLTRLTHDEDTDVRNKAQQTLNAKEEDDLELEDDD